MKKEILLVIMMILLSVSVSAFSFEWLTGWFTAEPATIESVTVYPEKVRPGDVLLVTAQVSGDIDTIVAHIYHEKGFDEVSMVTIGSVGDKRTYEARWIVHDTLNEKWYDVDVIGNGNIVMSTQFLDPEQGHDWAQIRNKPTIPTVPSDVCTASNGKCGGDVPQGSWCGYYIIDTAGSRIMKTIKACDGLNHDFNFFNLAGDIAACPSSYSPMIIMANPLQGDTGFHLYRKGVLANTVLTIANAMLEVKSMMWTCVKN